MTFKFNHDSYLKSPCLNCPERHPNCHSECADYKKFKQDLAEINEKRHEVEGKYVISESKAKWIRRKQRMNARNSAIKF